MDWQTWYDALEKPSWTPAPDLIRTIWMVLYPIIFITFGTVFIQAFRKKIPKRVVIPFAVNLLANFAFMPILIGTRNLPLALIDILIVWTSIVWCATVIWRYDRWVVFTLLPYFWWISIATVLQFSITLSNGDT